MLDDFMNKTDGMRDRYDELYGQYNFTDGLPKEFIVVNLNESLSADRRAFITNGIRAFFKDDLTLLLDRKELDESVRSNL